MRRIRSIGRPGGQSLTLGLVVMGLAGGPALAEAPVDPKLAKQYFAQARAISEADGGKLWGVKLYGPMLFADPSTHAVVANQADAGGELNVQDGVYGGRLPENVNIANTSMHWSGTDWTMMIWPLPQDEGERGQLIAHELWHRVQSDIGLTGSNAANAHLDSMEGRLWLQLEWRALEAALKQSEGERLRAMSDALLFRSHRRSLIPGCDVEERAMEMHEGLAEYTGVKLATASTSDAAQRAIRRLREGPTRRTFVRSFAYASGPAYGILLDEANAAWRKGLTPRNDFGGLLRDALSLTIPSEDPEEVRARAAAYGYDGLHASESAREMQRQRRSAELRARFVDGPVLTIALRNMNIEFNPGNLVPLGELGTVYPTARITDVWGVLTVTDGALLNKEWTEVVVTAPEKLDADPLVGKGWQLTPYEDWAIAPDEKAGSFRLKRGP